MTRLAKTSDKLKTIGHDLDQLNAIFRKWFTSLTQNFFMQGDCLAHIIESFFARFSLANATWKAGDLSNHKPIFAWI
jgi:hypothetical protein